MNRGVNIGVFFRQASAPVFLQDKKGLPRLSAASGQPFTDKIPALTETKSSQTQKHSTKRKTVFAGGWIDIDTDVYIQNRQRQTRDSQGHVYSRSKIIAMMLRERAMDETFQKSQSILLPLIQEVLRSEFRLFERRFLGIMARIAYKVSWGLFLNRNLVSLILANNPALFHRIDDQGEKDARVFVTERNAKIEEVTARLQNDLEK